MGAQLWSTGPAHIHIGIYGPLIGTTMQREASQVLYLGTCEERPIINTYTVYEPAYSDTRGPRLPDDWLLAGEHAISRIDLTRWDEATYAAIAKKGSKPMGSIARKDIGAMVRRQALTFILIVVFPFAVQNAYRGMPKGYVLKQSTLQDEVILPGTQAFKRGLVVHSIYDDKSQEELELYELSTDGANLALQK